jgi:hypothetical protein
VEQAQGSREDCGGADGRCTLGAASRRLARLLSIPLLVPLLMHFQTVHSHMLELCGKEDAAESLPWLSEPLYVSTKEVLQRIVKNLCDAMESEHEGTVYQVKEAVPLQVLRISYHRPLCVAQHRSFSSLAHNSWQKRCLRQNNCGRV